MTENSNSSELVSVVLPVFNEERRIGHTLREIIKYFHEHHYRFELLVVDNASKDGTVRVVEEVDQQLSTPIRVVRNGRNRGKGFSIRRGILEANGDIILFSDADLSTPIEEFSEFLALIHAGADCVIGTRHAEGSQIDVRQPRLREICGRALHRLVQLLVVSGYTDYTCGFKCYRLEMARAIYGRMRIGGWAFDIEALYLAGKYGFKVKEKPIIWSNSPFSKVRVIDGIFFVVDLLRIRLNDLMGLYRAR